MRVGVMVNRVEEVQVDQTTALLAARARHLGHEVLFFGVGDLEVSTRDRPLAYGRALSEGATRPALIEGAKRARPQRVELGEMDLILLRTNPGRDPRAGLQRTAMGVVRMARELGARVCNDPDGIERAGGKLALSRLPSRWRPETLISADPGRLAKFVRDREGASVLKPLEGTQGRDVYVLRPPALDNLSAISATVTRQGYAIAQACVPQAADGDVRLILLDGALLEVEGRVAAVRRRPGAGEFRSNVAAGGSAEAAEVPALWRELVDEVGPLLMGEGIRLAGLDLVGDTIVEVNVASPGGLLDAERFEGVDFVGAVLDRLLGDA